MNLDHMQVSELLAAYVGDELNAEQAADVRAHLDGCETCRAEWIGVRTLAELPDERLEPSERVALRDAVRARVEKKSWSRRLAPALGAVGLVAVVVVGAATILGDGVGGDSDIAAEGPLGKDRVVHDQAEGGAATQEQVAGREGTARSEDTTATNDTTSAAGAAQAAPAQTDALFSAALSYADAGPLRPHLLSVLDRDAFNLESRRTLGRLLRNAPNGRWADQMNACNDAVTSFLPAGARASYAAVYPTDGLLVMGFVWSEEAALRYAFWGWPAGDCSAVTPIFATGSL